MKLMLTLPINHDVKIMLNNRTVLFRSFSGGVHTLSVQEDNNESYRLRIILTQQKEKEKLSLGKALLLALSLIPLLRKDHALPKSSLPAFKRIYFSA